MNRGIFMTPGREEEWTLSVTHTDEAVDAYVAVFDEMAGELTLVASGAARWHGVEKRVEPLELFFDLVFVFALTQVTARMADDLSWGGLLRGLLVLAAIWWAWAAYAWLTNEVDGRRWPSGSRSSAR